MLSTFVLTYCIMATTYIGYKMFEQIDSINARDHSPRLWRMITIAIAKDITWDPSFDIITLRHLPLREYTWGFFLISSLPRFSISWPLSVIAKNDQNDDRGIYFARSPLDIITLSHLSLRQSILRDAYFRYYLLSIGWSSVSRYMIKTMIATYTARDRFLITKHRAIFYCVAIYCVRLISEYISDSATFYFVVVIWRSRYTGCPN